jgi:hypothetical protein
MEEMQKKYGWKSIWSLDKSINFTVQKIFRK